MRQKKFMPCKPFSRKGLRLFLCHTIVTKSLSGVDKRGKVWYNGEGFCKKAFAKIGGFTTFLRSRKIVKGATLYLFYFELNRI